MTFAQSRKSFSCWNCEYFVHENPEESYGGYCRRKAPKALDLYGPGSFVLTTKGDLLTRNSEELVRLPVGDENQVIIADPTEDSGLKWDYFENPNFTFVNAAQVAEPGVFPQDAIVFATPGSFPAGVYLIVASYLWGMSGLTDQFWSQVVVDASPGTPFGFIENGQPANSSEFQCGCGNIVLSLPAGAQNITVQIGVQPGGSTDNALIKEVRMALVCLRRAAP